MTRRVASGLAATVLIALAATPASAGPPQARAVVATFTGFVGFTGESWTLGMELAPVRVCEAVDATGSEPPPRYCFVRASGTAKRQAPDLFGSPRDAVSAWCYPSGRTDPTDSYLTLLDERDTGFMLDLAWEDPGIGLWGGVLNSIGVVRLRGTAHEGPLSHPADLWMLIRPGVNPCDAGGGFYYVLAGTLLVGERTTDPPPNVPSGLPIEVDHRDMSPCTVPVLIQPELEVHRSPTSDPDRSICLFTQWPLPETRTRVTVRG